MRQSPSLHLHPVESSRGHSSRKISSEVHALREFTQRSCSISEVASKWVTESRSVSVLLEEDEKSVVLLFLDGDDLEIIGRMEIGLLKLKPNYRTDPLRTDWSEVDEEGNLVLEDSWFNERNLGLGGRYREDFDTWMVPLSSGDRLLASYLLSGNGTGRLFKGIFGYTCLQVLYFDEPKECGWMEEFFFAPSLSRATLSEPTT
ncbi:MAG: hypothetical protein KDD64_00695 [Bdellovibrionales bacterium]|nr:hypothetical protein [Bdellovibrionales bacterium]